MFEAFLAAAGSLFSKDGPKAFIDSIQKAHDGVRKLQRMSRGEDVQLVDERKKKAAQDLIRGLGGFAPKIRRPKP